MKKIASPTDLDTTLRGLIASNRGGTSREAMAAELLSLADRVAVTRYNYEDEHLTQAKMLQKAKAKEAAFMGSASKPTFHAIMPNGKVFKITEKVFKKSSLPDETTDQTKTKLVSLAAPKLSIAESVEFNTWAKGKTVDQKLNWLHGKKLAKTASLQKRDIQRALDNAGVTYETFSHDGGGFDLGKGWKIYWDSQDASNEGWAFRSPRDSGEVDSKRDVEEFANQFQKSAAIRMSITKLAGVAGLSTGDKVKILSRRGKWPVDRFTKGSILDVQKGGTPGELVEFKRDMGGGSPQFKLDAGPKGTYKLETASGPYAGRSLKVEVI